jgi:hypothetical protein
VSALIDAGEGVGSDHAIAGLRVSAAIVAAIERAIEAAPPWRGFDIDEMPCGAVGSRVLLVQPEGLAGDVLELNTARVVADG